MPDISRLLTPPPPPPPLPPLFRPCDASSVSLRTTMDEGDADPSPSHSLSASGGRWSHRLRSPISTRVTYTVVKKERKKCSEVMGKSLMADRVRVWMDSRVAQGFEERDCNLPFLAKNAKNAPRMNFPSLRRAIVLCLAMSCLITASSSGTTVDGFKSAAEATNPSTLLMKVMQGVKEFSSQPCGCAGCKWCTQTNANIDPSIPLFLMDTNVYLNHPFIIHKAILSNVIVPAVVEAEVKHRNLGIGTALVNWIEDAKTGVRKFWQDQVGHIKELDNKQGESKQWKNDLKIVATCSLYQEHLTHFNNGGRITFISDDKKCKAFASSRKIDAMNSEQFIDYIFNRDRKFFLEKVYGKHKETLNKHEKQVSLPLEQSILFQEKGMKRPREDFQSKQKRSSDMPSSGMERMREVQAGLKMRPFLIDGHVKPGQTSDPRSGFATVEKDRGGLTPMLGDKKF